MKGDPSLKDVEYYLHHEYFHATDPRMDGWNTFARKQNIYRVMWLAEEYLAKCPTYGEHEEQWLEEHRVEQAIEKIKNG